MKKVVFPNNKMKDAIELLCSNKLFTVEDRFIYEDKWASLILSYFTYKTMGSAYTIAMCNLFKKDIKDSLLEIIYINNLSNLLGFNPGSIFSRKIESKIAEYFVKNIEGAKIIG